MLQYWPRMLQYAGFAALCVFGTEWQCFVLHSFTDMSAELSNSSCPAPYVRLACAVRHVGNILALPGTRLALPRDRTCSRPVARLQPGCKLQLEAVTIVQLQLCCMQTKTSKCIAVESMQP